LILRAGEVFTPQAPIDKSSLFAGRKHQLRQVVDAINQRGQHAIIFGERGVGKTSLANVLSENIRNDARAVVAPHVNCDSADDFSSLWRKIFVEIQVTQQTRQIGFVGEVTTTLSTFVDPEDPKEFSSADVRRILSLIGEHVLLIIIVDEFDRLDAGKARRVFADTIKLLSDQSVRVTIIAVGVADTVNELIQEHLSIERNLMQVQMPRMSLVELSEIIERGLKELELDIDDGAKERITKLSRGLPHYTHLLSRHAVRAAVDAGELRISTEHVDLATAQALDEAQQSIRHAYHEATMSTRKDHLYEQVLLACALAEADDFGYFAPADVRDPMSRIMKRPYDIPSFARHLNDFCSKERGCILEKTGVPHRYRYRFANPLLQPYATFRGLRTGLVDLRTI